MNVTLKTHPNHAEGVYGIARNASAWNQLAELYGIKPQGKTCTLARDAIRLRRFHTMRKRIDAIPSLRLG